MNYITALSLLHETLRPANYCEIGCRLGLSLSLSKAPAIGVDPDFEIKVPLAAPTRLSKMTSDDFFAQPDVARILGEPIDLAFIDGMHVVEFALRDFMNLERHASPTGVIAVDDLLPSHMDYATRERRTRIWSGDVYRLVPILRHYRPDLDIRVYDVEMKGFGLVSRLDPSSRVLTENYAKIEDEIAAGQWRFPTVEATRAHLQPQPTDTLAPDLQALADWRMRGAGRSGQSLDRSERRDGALPEIKEIDWASVYFRKAGDLPRSPAVSAGRSPRLSVIVCAYEMQREAPRTILSSALPYQEDVRPEDYEVIVVDNGSRVPLSCDDLPAGVSIVRMPSPRPSPVFAMNWAAREIATGSLLLFAIDGARIFSKRLYAETLKAHELVDDAFVFTLGWHIGPKKQGQSVPEGYNQEIEDRLIGGSGWPQSPDALFDISVFAASSAPGFFGHIAESNAFSISRSLFERHGGFDERFMLPGGGFANLEIFQRYVTRPGARNVCLLSEGTFHQFHDLATTGKPKFRVFAEEYQAIFGRPYILPICDVLYVGKPRPGVVPFLRQSVGERQLAGSTAEKP